MPARELLVFGGADGMFDWYDDAGDGYEKGILIPLRYTDTDRTLVIGRMDGRLAEKIRITVRFRMPDGREQTREVSYNGLETAVCYSEE